ncbi:MAG: glycerophosphodiester phosphodiesterase [Nitrospirae bacterium]|nr:glycerophosphodiester phosphodiesterase [Nitrospirota bacterium]
MPDILNIAHRGSSGNAPENTLSAFRLAIKQRADMIELDVHQTRDSHIIVLHDEYLKTGILKKRLIKDMTLKEIREINKNIPTLKQVLMLIKEKIRLNIEIKHSSGYYPDIERNVYSLLKKERMLFDTIISSFDIDCLKKFRKISDDIIIGFLYNKKDWRKALKQSKDLKAYSFHVSDKILSKEIVDKVHKSGMRLFVYTINDEDEIALGIVLAGIIIILTKKLLRAMKASKTEEYSIRIKCRKCGWEGEVAKYARICPRCGRKAAT